MIFAVIEIGPTGNVFAHGYFLSHWEAAHYISESVCHLTTAELDDLVESSPGIVDRGMDGSVHILPMTSLEDTIEEDLEGDDFEWGLDFEDE